MWLLLTLSLAASSVFAQTAPAPSLKVGDSALLFSLPAVNEDVALRQVARGSVALSDYTGVSPGFPARAVVVTFSDGKASAQWQMLSRLQKKYQNKGVRFIIIVADEIDIATLSNAVASAKLDVPLLHDRYGIVAGRYGVKAMPMTFVVDGDGYVDAIGVAKDNLEIGLDSILADLTQ